MRRTLLTLSLFTGCSQGTPFDSQSSESEAWGQEDTTTGTPEHTGDSAAIPEGAVLFDDLPDDINEFGQPWGHRNLTWCLQSTTPDLPVADQATALQDAFGRRALLLPMGADSVTMFRAAVEILVGAFAKAMEVFDPPEWQGELDLIVSDSLLAGTLTADNFPFARGKPGELTPVL